MPIALPIDYNAIRVALAREIVKVTKLSPNQVLLAEPETWNEPRPKKPYFSFKITTPGAKFGDDDHDQILDSEGNPTPVWNSGGQRQMTVVFDCYGNSHEEAYNYMALWQTALDMENIQADLRSYLGPGQPGISVYLIGSVADLSALLNTGYEGRSHLEVQFGIAMNLSSDLGYMDQVEVQGTIDVGNGFVHTDTIVSNT